MALGLVPTVMVAVTLFVLPSMTDTSFSLEYKRHQQTHLQTHIDRWSKQDKISWKPPEGMTQDLFKIFEKYRLGERAMLCLWVNGQLNTAIREPSRIFELQDGGLTE